MMREKAYGVSTINTTDERAEGGDDRRGEDEGL